MHVYPTSLARVLVYCVAFALIADLSLASPPAAVSLDRALFDAMDVAGDLLRHEPALGTAPSSGTDGTIWSLNSFQNWSRRIERFSRSLTSRSLAPPTPSIEPEKRSVTPRDIESEALPYDTDALREWIADRPFDLGSFSIGTPDAGALFNGFTLADGPLWRVRDPRDAWATEETLAFIIAAIQAVEARHPGSPALCIGDLSRRQGGPIDKHRSHQSGRDVDLGWYYKEGAVADLCQGDLRRLDIPRCWALVHALVTETDIERIFIDRKIQRVLFRHALEIGENLDWLEGLFESPGGRRDTIIQHERGHKSHLHARFYNRRAQEWGRLAYPLLLDAGLAPPPVVIHRARRGDTLSTIARRYGTSVAKIRRANRLRSSFIRAGRRYRIPTRLNAAVGQAPVVVPPRRLPPAPVVITDNSDESPEVKNRPSVAKAISREQADESAQKHRLDAVQ